ncbi:TIGR00730 family Rossman fold protein [Patescibacteria group bacterium]|nr:TIGR00730 family Rossman fold protein [Patescibacteria group bacterium]MBU1500962.1 TIGR00730 family Rossman fold protein [Patescibacteria group bacterium]MBU2080592.1 TIGR00730 family Rossman fold protein [Patescibacteria group bacterium]MBU2124333.1 TIGR00730 family Rossman fold protein [Patescibacteria group bacterium]MBU2194459.1 TIGR00730 family Rossman fold protein [Patescibacteria group bacterium]
MGSVLARAIEEGRHDVPQNPAPLVCKPKKLESWRVFKIMAEFVDGFDLLKDYGLTATFFGSVRTQPGDPYYEAAVDLGARLAKSGFAIVTGGSAGIMEAGNKGAYDAGGSSVGLNIRLSDDQSLNKYINNSFTFDHFFVRKVMLAFASQVYVYFPGGYGTLDEFTEILTLVQTKKIKEVPILLYGKDYWDPIVDLFKNHLYAKFHNIDEADLNLFHVVDSVEEAHEYITKNVTC